jgi:hypothetical protein
MTPNGYLEFWHFTVHDGVKWYGKEKIADSPDPIATAVSRLREELYEGRAFANALASEGFVVLAYDVFLWGSRRFPLESMPDQLFTLKGMEEADSKIRSHYRHSGEPELYQSRFYPGLHKVDRAMQADAFAWLKQELR